MVRIKTLLKLVTYLCIATGYASVSPYVEPYYAVSFAVLAGLAVTLDFTKPLRIPRWVLNCISVGVLAYSCSRINPDYLIEPILNSLVILIAIKSLEDKKFRDYMQIYAICMFLLIDSSLISFSMIFIVYFCLLFALSTLSLMLLAYFSHDAETAISRDNLLKVAFQAVLICAISIPASSLFFLILPRTNYPIFSFLNKLVYSTSGFSDTVTLGEVSEIQEDSHVVFRAEMKKVDESMLYWRGIELDQFDGIAWTAGSKSVTFPDDSIQGERIFQTIYLEPYGNRYLFALDKPISIVSGGRRPRRLLSNVWYGNLFERISYTAESASGIWLPQKSLNTRPYLQLPPDFSPAIVKLVEGLLAGSDQDPVMTLYDFVKFGPYQYSLENLPVSKTPVEDFLFSRKRGNCEYFASALAVMLRMADIPARLIGGYRGGYYNGTGGYYLVLQKNAHVWVEAYSASHGWLRLDPTPYAVDSPAARYGRSLFLQLKLLLDTFNYYWGKFVLSYDFSRQVRIMKKIGSIFEGPPLMPHLNKTTLKKILPAAGVLLVVAALFLLYFIPGKNLEERLISRFLRKMAGRGYEKKRTEGLEEFISCIDEEPLRLKATAFVEEFQSIYYRDYRLTKEQYSALANRIREI